MFEFVGYFLVLGVWTMVKSRFNAVVGLQKARARVHISVFVVFI